MTLAEWMRQDHDERVALFETAVETVAEKFGYCPTDVENFLYLVIVRDGQEAMQ